MNKPLEDRLDEEYDDLIEIVKKIDVFSKYQKGGNPLARIDYLEFCSKLKYKYLPKGEPLFRTHDDCDKMYFLMYG